MARNCITRHLIFAQRVSDYQYNPFLGILLDQLQIRPSSHSRRTDTHLP